MNRESANAPDGPVEPVGVAATEIHQYDVLLLKSCNQKEFDYPDSKLSD